VPRRNQIGGDAKDYCNGSRITNYAAQSAYEVTLVAWSDSAVAYSRLKNLSVQLLEITIRHSENLFFSIMFVLHKSTSAYMIYFFADGLIGFA
jgi:hypothetical protein